MKPWPEVSLAEIAQPGSRHQDGAEEAAAGAGGLRIRNHRGRVGQRYGRQRHPGDRHRKVGGKLHSIVGAGGAGQAQPACSAFQSINQ